MEHLKELRALAMRHSPDPRTATVIPRVTLINSPTTTVPGPALYEPIFCVAIQGRKQLTVGEKQLFYDPANFLLVSVGLPVTAGIVEASPDSPYLAISLRLDAATIAAMLLEIPHAGDEEAAAIAVGPMTDALLGPIVRLARLLDHPEDIPLLAPLAERELLYRLIRGPQGAQLRQIALADSRLSRISRAIDWIRRRYQEPFRIEIVAEVAGMSPSSFHRHFKAATAMSPLQYQKQIRLQEARRLLIAEPISAGNVAFAVGYESPSQFSREYARQFGMPPARDAARLRGAQPAASGF